MERWKSGVMKEQQNTNIPVRRRTFLRQSSMHRAHPRCRTQLAVCSSVATARGVKLD